MQKIELLSPAGKKESAYAAIQNGADAIYMSGTKFGARAFADNFSLADIQEILDYAHGYHVRVYITLNTVLYEYEITECMEYVKQLYELQVDALIVQDLGLLYLIRTTFPDFEVHASTQMHVYNREALLFLQAQGVKRAVLARECTLEQLCDFQDIAIEKEVFVHGALCIAFSGQCLFSAMNNQRSGNRGACAQGCRMPYELLCKEEVVHDKAYLLSPKDLNVLEEIEVLKKVGITSFKIEGRMKSSEYVAHMTALYRKALDQHNYQVTPEELMIAKVLFHRKYTKGHLFQAKQLMNYERPNHEGIRIGKVIQVSKQRMKLYLEGTLHQHDGIRILQAKERGFQVNRMYKDGLLVNQAKAGDTIELDTFGELIQKQAIVLKTKDVEVEKQLQTTYQTRQRTVGLKANLVIELDKPIKLTIWDEYQHELTMTSDYFVQAAQKQATTALEIEARLQKTGDTIYTFEAISIAMDQAVFIPARAINELRREALKCFYDIAKSPVSREVTNFVLDPLRKPSIQKRSIEITVLTEVQLKACLTYDDVVVYVADKALFQRYQEHAQVRYRQSNVATHIDDTASMVGDIGGLNRNCSLDYSLNIMNSYTLEYLQRLHNQTMYLSLELDDAALRATMEAYQERNQAKPDVGMVVYGKVKLMSSKHCPVNSICADGTKQHCQRCKQQPYYLRDTFGKRFFLYGDEWCTMHIYHHEAIDKLAQIQVYQQLGISTFRLDFTDETPTEMAEIYRKCQKCYR